jgi:nicotinic acid mononucleotide adenylyltransferase
MNQNTENIIFFTIGRMNPPTPGHMLLIRTMMEGALQKGLTQINLILSATTDNKKNPLSCEEKRYFILNFMIHHLKELMKIEQPQMAEKIDEIQVKIICMNDIVNPKYGKHPILKSVQYLLQDLYGYPRMNLQMVLFIGEDRIQDYNWIQKSLLERNPPLTMEIHGLDRPEGAMSATYIRQLALEGNLSQFRLEMEKTGLDESSILNLYN